jgi:hypothetical protein
VYEEINFPASHKLKCPSCGHALELDPTSGALAGSKR